MNEESNFVKKNGMLLSVSRAEQYGGLMAFSLRTGGLSPHPFNSLNFSASQGDSIENVRNNFVILGENLGINPERIATCKQVHGDRIKILDSIDAPPPVADALISVRPDIFPAVKTADCVPILLLDPPNQISAAIHAGWRSTVLHITRKVLQVLMTEFGTNPKDVLAALGPGIGPCCYEVDEVVIDPIRKHFSNADEYIFIQESGRGKSTAVKFYWLDLAGINYSELISSGVPPENIINTGLCTCCNPNLFFSYRRDGAKSGRHIAIAGFRP